MEICSRTVICNVWCLGVSGYNEVKKKGGEAVEKKEDVERRE